MKRSPRTALDVLFPGSRSTLLRVLFSKPTRRRYVRELRGLSGLALSTVQHELRKLHALDLLITWSNGYHRFYQANGGDALVPHLIRVVEIADGSKLDPSALRSRRRAPRKRRLQKRAAGLRSGPPGWGIFHRRSNSL